MCSKKTLNTKLYCDNTIGMRKVLTKKTKNKSSSISTNSKSNNQFKESLRCCNVAGWILIVDHLHKNMLDGSVFGIWLVISKILAFSFLFWFFSLISIFVPNALMYCLFMFYGWWYICDLKLMKWKNIRSSGLRLNIIKITKL